MSCEIVLVADFYVLCMHMFTLIINYFHFSFANEIIYCILIDSQNETLVQNHFKWLTFELLIKRASTSIWECVTKREKGQSFNRTLSIWINCPADMMNTYGVATLNNKHDRKWSDKKERKQLNFVKIASEWGNALNGVRVDKIDNLIYVSCVHKQI